jgi:hypothetical protein
MGMFDELRCEYPLPDPEVQEELFQTKSFENLLDYYAITKDGRLIKYEIGGEPVAAEKVEKPVYHGAADTESDPLARIVNVVRTVPIGEVEIAYQGDIRFYTHKETKRAGKKAWYEYQAHFTGGKVQWIQRVEERN